MNNLKYGNDIIENDYHQNSAKRLYDTVIKGGYCIGCGSCASLFGSPFEMKLDKYGKMKAYLNPNEIKDFERLIHSISLKAGSEANKPLFLEAVKKVNDNNYIIQFGVGGHGVAAPGQRRVEEVLVDISFNPRTGVIKVINTNVESPIATHEWSLMPADFQLHFMPNQPKDEIISSVATLLKYY